MTEKKPDCNKAIVIGGYKCISAPRSKMISRGLKTAEFLERTVLTIIRDIIVDIRKDGLLMKMAIIDPVKIKDKEISRFVVGPVFNEREMPAQEITRDYDYRIGDTITIEYSGPDVLIPFLMRTIVVKEKRTGNEKEFITVPDKCPVCGCKLKIGQPLPYYYCTGNTCPGKIKAQIIAFSNSMNIDLNRELIKELVDKRMISDPADLYFLKKQDMLQLNKIDEESAQQVLDAIEKSRHPKLVDVMTALLETGGLRPIIGFELAVYCNSINDLYDPDMLAQIKSTWIRPNDVIAIQKFMNESKTLKFLEKLKRGGVVFPRRGDN